MIQNEILVYTDGAFSAKSKVGGWAFCLVDKNNQKVFQMFSGGALGTTNQRMELTAVVAGLEKLVLERKIDKNTEVTVISDSKYCVGYVAENWRYVWNELSDWKNAEGKDIANKDLWLRLESVLCKMDARKIRYDFQWVRGHTGNKYNEYCDKRAVKEKELMLGRYNKVSKTKDELLDDIKNGRCVGEVSANL